MRTSTWLCSVILFLASNGIVQAQFIVPGTANPYAVRAGGVLAPTFTVAPGSLNITPLPPPGAAPPGFLYPPPFTGIFPEPFGGYLQGAASVIGAQGKFLIDKQQAAILRERARQAGVETRRMIFDQWLYERENTPTLEQERERFQKQELMRSLNDPPATELLTGKPLNDILLAVQKLGPNRPAVTDTPFNVDLLKRINVSKVGTTSNIGLLKANDGRLEWPETIVSICDSDEGRDLLRKLDAMAVTVVEQAQTGKPDRGILKEMADRIKKLDEMLTSRVKKIDFGPYTEAKKFVASLSEAVRTLQSDPNASDFFTGKAAAVGKNATELLKHMSEKGLRFGPAAPGNEDAYLALHQALVAHYRALMTASGK